MMSRITLWLLCIVILCNVYILESRKVSSGGGRRTTWSRPSSGSVQKPKPQPTFTHSDISRLSYGHNEPSGARRQSSPPKSTNTGSHKPHDSHKPSAPPADHNIHPQSAPRPSNTAPNNPGNPNNPNPNNIGWNVNQNNPAGSNPNPNNIGWNTGQNSNIQPQRVNNVNNAPPPYPGAPSPNNYGAPPGSPGYHGPPPPYPGNTGYHGQPNNYGPPPPYPGNTGYHGQPNNYGPPPPYPGLNNNYPKQGGYPGGYPQQGYGGYPGGYGGYPGGYGGGYGSPGGFGGLGGLGGFGGYGGGYGGYGGGSLFAPKRSSGFSGTSFIGGALLGWTLYSLTRNTMPYSYSYPNSRPMYSNKDGNGNVINVEHTFNGEQGSYTSYVGNVTCVSIYNAKEVSKWANSTLEDFYRQYPTQRFPVDVNSTNALNFTIVPGDIIHNETLAVTCCGTDHSVDLMSIANGKTKDVNCIYKTFQMPFRRLQFIPINNTAINNTNADNSTSNAPVVAALTSTSIPGNEVNNNSTTKELPATTTPVPTESTTNNNSSPNATITSNSTSVSETTTPQNIEPTTIKN